MLLPKRVIRYSRGKSVFKGGNVSPHPGQNNPKEPKGLFSCESAQRWVLEESCVKDLGPEAVLGLLMIWNGSG